MQTEAVGEAGPVVAGTPVTAPAVTGPVVTGPVVTGPAVTGPAVTGPAVGGTGDDVPWTPPTWEEVVREHSARVYRLAYRLTGNCHDAEDLTQEVFVRVFRSLPSYTPGTFEGWLHRITTNLFLDMARRKQRIRFEGRGEEAAARLGDGGPSPAQAFDDRHLDTDIQA